jgi:hypothetical protein
MTKIQTISIFLEGEYDEIIFKRNISKLFRNRGFKVELITYREEEKDFVPAYLNTILHLSLPHLYIFITDLDRYFTISERRESIKKFYNNELDPDHIFVIVKMIEGWYLAGLNRKKAKELSINLNEYDKLDPNIIKKDDFLRLKPQKYNGKRAFYIDVANSFSQSDAKIKNTSFKNFLEIYSLE